MIVDAVAPYDDQTRDGFLAHTVYTLAQIIDYRSHTPEADAEFDAFLANLLDSSLGDAGPSAERA